MTLPDLGDLENATTIGPNGEFRTNINGSAVSIECFLDLSYKTRKTATVRWTSFNKDLSRYQGALEDKDFYTTQFKKALKKPENYDFRKLNILIDKIYKQCIALAKY